MISLRAIKKERPLYTWWDCAVLWYRLRQESLDPVPWAQIGYGAIVVCLGIVLLAQAVRQYDQENWVCTRAGYAPVRINGELVPATPCIQETHIRTGEVRVTTFGKLKEQS